MKNLKLKILAALLFCSIQFIWASTSEKISFTKKLFSSQRHTASSVNDAAINKESILLSFAVSPVPCNGNSIDLTIQGGAFPYTYLWSNGETTEDLLHVNPGTYQVTVSDNMGLQQSGEVTVIGDSALSVSALVNDVSCPRVRDGSARVVVNGGKAPYSYLWSNGSTTSEIINQNGGTFSVTVTDVTSCSKTTQVTIAAPPRFGFNIQQEDNICAGGNKGSINVIVSGGSDPYRYIWSTGDTVPSIQNLSSGTYQLNITDRRNCRVGIDATILAPEEISVQASTSKDCSGGNIDLEVNGGTPPYSYLWSNGATAQNLKGLLAGSYTVEVKDANGCLRNPLTVKVSNYNPVIYEVHKKDVSCFGLKDGSISIKILSGNGPYNYEWSNGSISSSISGLIPGSYSLKITDGNGCNNAINRIINEPATLTSSVSISQNNVDVSVTGGVAPYTYLWSNGATTEDLTNQGNGTYTVQILDHNSCFTTQSAVIDMTLKASIDCCTDTYINKGSATSIPVNFNMPGPYVLKYKEIYDKKTSSIKTVTTSANPFVINATAANTTTYELISVSKDNVTGTVCGRATVGVNNSIGNCASNCFRAELQSVVNDGFCKTFTMKIVNDGYCRYALSHLSISVPCGNIVSVSNSRNFPIEYGMDPTTKINGFKIDGVNNFGEKKNGIEESFFITYTICSENETCPVPACATLMSFKAGQCVFYNKAIESAGSEGRMAQSTLDYEHLSTDNPDQVMVYPNPIESNGILNLVLPNTNKEGKAIVKIHDTFGKEIYNNEFTLDHSNQEVILQNISNFPSGLYLITIQIGESQYLHKIIVQ
jgi:hypothetical protein